MANETSALAIRLVFINKISFNRVFLIRNPLLIQGTWNCSPDAWEPSNTVPWQGAQEATAEGDRPTGVNGQADLEIPASQGEQSAHSRLTFAIDGSGAAFLIDGATFKVVQAGDELFSVTLTSSVDGSTLAGQLVVTDLDDEAEWSRTYRALKLRRAL